MTAGGLYTLGSTQMDKGDAERGTEVPPDATGAVFPVETEQGSALVTVPEK